MAKSYTIKKKDDGTTSVTRTNDDGTKTNVDKNFAPTNSAVGRDGNVDSSINANPSGKGYAGASSGGSSSSSSSSRDALINQYVNSAKQAKINQLKNAYNQNIAAIAQQERETAQNAQANRNTASVQSQLAQRQLDNYLAANGLLNSGTNAQARMNNVGALQNTLGGITANEQNALNQLASQRTLAKTNLNNDIAAANAGYDAQALQMQLQYLDQLEQMRMQQDYANQQALQQRQWALEDRDYNRDMNYIWDNNLGRYVDSNTYWNNYWNNNLTAYQRAQLANANRTSSGGGSGAKGSSGNTDILSVTKNATNLANNLKALGYDEETAIATALNYYGLGGSSANDVSSLASIDTSAYEKNDNGATGQILDTGAGKESFIDKAKRVISNELNSGVNKTVARTGAENKARANYEKRVNELKDQYKDEYNNYLSITKMAQQRGYNTVPLGFEEWYIKTKGAIQ